MRGEEPLKNTQTRESFLSMDEDELSESILHVNRGSNPADGEGSEDVNEETEDEKE